MMASNSSTLIHVPFGEFGIPLRPYNSRFTGSFKKLGDMVSDVEPMVFPSRDVGGEFVGKVSIAGLLSKLDAGAPYKGWIFGSGLRFYLEKKAEKIPIGFDSKKSFTKMDEDSSVAD
jgi:hypothetical protein